MRRFCTAVALVALVAFCGCNKSEPGGPGVKPGTTRSSVTGTTHRETSSSKETFKISAPATATHLKPGKPWVLLSRQPPASSAR